LLSRKPLIELHKTSFCTESPEVIVNREVFYSNVYIFGGQDAHGGARWHTGEQGCSTLGFGSFVLSPSKLVLSEVEGDERPESPGFPFLFRPAQHERKTNIEGSIL
jgi:hypothetical protein